MDRPLDITEVSVTKEELLKFVRAEIPFSALIHTELDGSYCLIDCDEAYELTPEDLLKALSNMEQGGWTTASFINEWFSPLCWTCFQACSLQKALGIKDEDSGLWKQQVSLFVDPGKRTELLYNVFRSLIELSWEIQSGHLEEDDKVTFDEECTTIRYFLYNEGKKRTKWKRTDAWKHRIITAWEERLSSCGEEELEVFRKCTDELLEQGSLTAMRIKGYAMYGGNEAYPCDWKQSAQLLEKVMIEDHDPGCANTLGYICYYGRNTDGIPDYDKAFKCFSLGASFGIHESMYKLGDMFYHGYGVWKNEYAALHLYIQVYEQTTEAFCKGNYGVKFADAALRMGMIYENGTCANEAVPLYAYTFYLQALYAIRLRLKNYDDYGDRTVERNIMKSVYRMKSLLKDEVRQDEIHYQRPYIIRNYMKKNTHFLMFKHTDDRKNYTLTFCRHDDNDPASIDRLLFTMPELSYCGLTDQIIIRCAGVKNAKFGPRGTPVKFNRIAYDTDTEMIRLFMDDTETCHFKCSDYSIRKEDYPK